MSLKDKKFTAVELPESPANSASQRNLTGLPRTVRDIAADIYNNIQQWNFFHIKGSTVIKEIVGLKANSKKNYPDGLEELSIVMYEIITSKEMILSNLKICSDQLKSVVILHKSVEPIFISWSADKIARIAEKIYDDYNREFQLKQFILENVCHVNRDDKLMFYAVSWTYQPFINKDTNLYLESLLTETGHRNKN